MAKEALYLVHAELEPAWCDEWNAWHSREHVPLVVESGGFAGASRVRHLKPDGAPVEPPRFTTVYRATGLGVVRAYLEGGEVGKMRAHHDAWLSAAKRTAKLSREVLEENYSVGASGKPEPRGAGADVRAAFVVRVRVEASAVAEWSVWYDGEHLPKVVQAGGFTRGGRWRVADDAAGAGRFAVIYEAGSAAVVAAFRAGPGPGFSKEHEAAFGKHVTLEREVWSAA